MIKSILVQSFCFGALLRGVIGSKERSHKRWSKRLKRYTARRELTGEDFRRMFGWEDLGDLTAREGHNILEDLGLIQSIKNADKITQPTMDAIKKAIGSDEGSYKLDSVLRFFLPKHGIPLHELHDKIDGKLLQDNGLWPPIYGFYPAEIAAQPELTVKALEESPNHLQRQRVLDEIYRLEITDETNKHKAEYKLAKDRDTGRTEFTNASALLDASEKGNIKHYALYMGLEAIPRNELDTKMLKSYLQFSKDLDPDWNTCGDGALFQKMKALVGFNADQKQKILKAMSNVLQYERPVHNIDYYNVPVEYEASDLDTQIPMIDTGSVFSGQELNSLAPPDESPALLGNVSGLSLLIGAGCYAWTRFQRFKQSLIGTGKVEDVEDPALADDRRRLIPSDFVLPFHPLTCIAQVLLILLVYTLYKWHQRCRANAKTLEDGTIPLFN